VFRRPYQTSDGLIGVLVYTDGQWRAFFELVGEPDLADDARFATMRARSENVDALYCFLEVQLRKRPTAEWLGLLAERGIPASRVNSIEDLFSDVHVAATDLFTTDEHPLVGKVRTMRLPVSFSRTQPRPVRYAPELGEHNELILGNDRPAGGGDA
jgi:crotonobetainyl-CoA:carnitine CoA-transferase CaiB-like acyl-CoA transferase